MTVLDQLRPIIALELAVEEAEVVAEAHLLDDLDADSMNLLVIFSKVGEMFDLEIDDEMALAIDTVEDLLKVIEARGG